jgi:hypothetical protein
VRGIVHSIVAIVVTYRRYYQRYEIKLLKFAKL